MWRYAVLEVNALLWTLLIGLTVILLRRLLAILKLWSGARRLPGPSSKFFMCNSRSFGNDSGPDSFTEFFGALHKEYGPVVRVWLGPTKLVVSVKALDMVKELLMQAKDRVPASRKAFQLAFGKGSLFFSSYRQAKRRRSVLYQEFNGHLLRNANSISLEYLESWIDFGKDGKKVESKAVSQHLSITVLGMCLFGENFHTWPAAAEFEKILVRVSKEACTWARYRVTPIWKQEFRSYQKMCSRLQDVMEELISLSRTETNEGHMGASYLKTIDAMRASRKEGCVSDRAHGLVQGLLTAIGVSQQPLAGPVNSLKEVNPHLLSLICHACFATSGIISGVLTRIAQHPNIQIQVYQEVIRVCGKDVFPKEGDLQAMHFLWATLYESARLLPISPFLQRCSVDKEVRLGQGVVVPAGATLVVPVQLLQMDSKSWGHDVEVFNPYRFLKPDEADMDQLNLHRRSTEGDVAGKLCAAGLQGQNWEAKKVNGREGDNAGPERLVFTNPEGDSSFLLFGAGSRVCVGKEFATRTMVTILACLIQKFEVKLASGSEAIMKPKLENFVLQLSPSPSLLFVPRSSLK